VQRGLAFEGVEFATLAGRAQELLHHQSRCWLDADFRARQEYLRASADGDAPFQHEWPEWLLGPGPFAVGCHSPPLERLSGERDSEKPRPKQSVALGCTQNRHAFVERLPA
jgi:hypothetical protein